MPTKVLRESTWPMVRVRSMRSSTSMGVGVHVMPGCMRSHLGDGEGDVATSKGAKTIERLGLAA